HARVHVAEKFFEKRPGEHLANHVEDLVRTQLTADLPEAVEQFLQNTALPSVLGHKIDDQAVVHLTVAVNAADALFEAHGVPGDVVVDHHPAKLKVDPFAGSLRGDEHLRRLLELPFGVNARTGSVAVANLHPTVDLGDRQTPFAKLADRTAVTAIAGQKV